MENLPQKTNPWPRRFEISGEILRIIAGGTIVLGSLVAPNLAQVLPLLGFDPKRRDEPYRVSDLSRAIKNLQKEKYVAKIRTQTGYTLRLTERGQIALARFEMCHFKLKKPQHWDGKWRLVIFDIREWHRHARDKIRRIITQHNFYHLQDSVWVYPYPCEEFIELLKTGLGVRHEVYYLVVSSMAYDEKVRGYFTAVFGRSFERSVEPYES